MDKNIIPGFHNGRKSADKIKLSPKAFQKNILTGQRLLGGIQANPKLCSHLVKNAGPAPLTHLKQIAVKIFDVFLTEFLQHLHPP